MIGQFMKKFIYFVFTMFCLNLNGYIKSDYVKAKKGNPDLIYTDLSDSTLYNIKFYGTDFYKCNLNKTDLTGSDFFCIENLEKAKNVIDTNFAYTTGLTNKQKQFLRENGAINVPKDYPTDFYEDITPDEIHEIVKTIFRKISNGSKEAYNWLRKNGYKVLALLSN